MCFYYTIATCYRLDGTGIESHCGFRFSTPIQNGPGSHPASCMMGVSVSFLELNWLWCCVHHPPYSSTEVKERVHLYLYSPLGLYGLFQVKLHLLSLRLVYLR